MSKLLLKTLSLTAATAALVSPALAGPTYENANGGSFTFYGHLDPSFLSVDDGVNTTSDLADNSSSNSRIGFYLRQPIGQSKFQFQFETALGLRGSADISQTNDLNAMDWDRTDIRKIDFSIAGSYGKFSFGQGSMASDGVAFTDLSGTGLPTTASVEDLASSFELTTTAGALSGISIGDAFPTFDGARLGRVRYDSMSLNGFTLSTSYGTNILTEGNDDEAYDVTVRYQNQFGDYNFDSALGVIWTDKATGADTRDISTSFSVMHSSGLNGAISYGDRDTGGNYGYIKLGYTANLFAIGSTAVSVDYYTGDDLVSVGSESESFGIGLVQNIDSANVETYLGYREYSYEDTSATTYNDLSALIFGARWSF
ncbi:porin [Antarcticimicrobium sediminis]|uniref:Porin n=1 Tax=Antarcticimicrobium sediminis TaxID=2546227 RepID=A0A4R5EYX4_9RHOB|nr:porin [Antarcticimicrobium sediminis]TDE40299.1 porin [Antarcticimicrobium sediminis]